MSGGNRITLGTDEGAHPFVAGGNDSLHGVWRNLLKAPTRRETVQESRRRNACLRRSRELVGNSEGSVSVSRTECS